MCVVGEEDLHFTMCRADNDVWFKPAWKNSYLHEYWIKLDDPKTTMMLQEMEKVLVPLGTPSSKHRRSY